MERNEGRRRGSVLLIVENAPVPRDRRVWQEAVSLQRAGWDVSVLGPRLYDMDVPTAEVIEGVRVYRFPLRRAESGVVGWLTEYGEALWRIRREVSRLSQRERFSVIHAANPPDLLLLAVLRQRRRGSALVFDQHDLMPEMATERFGMAARPLSALLRLTERLAHRLADVTVVANDSFRRIALERGGRAREDVVVVRNGPRLESFTPMPPDPALAKGRAHLLVYEGVMGPLDGVDHAIRSLAALRRTRDDWHAVFLGAGDAVPSLKRLTAELKLEDRVEFPGFVADDELRRTISTATVCLAPDPRNPLTDVSTLIKIAEYMAMGKPIVSYPLTESRVTAGDAAAYATADDPEDFARKIDELLDDPQRRERMGKEGRRRVEERFAWSHSERALLEAYDRAVWKAGARTGRRRGASQG